MSRPSMLARYHAAAIALIATLTVIVYYDSFKNSFVHDDVAFIVDNSAIKTLNPRSVVSYFTDRNSTSSIERLSSHVWRPLVTTSFAVDYHLWKLTSRFYHIENTFLHCVNAALVYGIAFLITGSAVAAFLAGLVFAIHPVQTEAVTWISGRSNLLFLVFFLAAFVMHIKSLEDPVRAGLRRGLSLFCFFLSLLSKETAIVFPLFLILHDAHFCRRPYLKEKIAYYSSGFLITAFYLAARTSVLERFGQIDIVWKGKVLSNTLTMLKAVCGYVRLAFLPANLHMNYYVKKAISPADPGVLMAIAVLSVAAGIYFLNRRNKAVSFYMVWFFLALAPVLNIVPVNTIMAERFLYLPMAGFAALFGIFFSGWIRDKEKGAKTAQAAKVTLALILLYYAFATVSRNIEWRSPIIFYTKEAKRSPSDPLAHNNLGLACAREARMCSSPGEAAAYRALAEREYKTAIELSPDYMAAYRNLANLYLEGARYAQAAENFRKAVAGEPGALSYNNMAVSCYYLGDLDGTIAACKEALLLDPGYQDAYVNLGNAFYMKGMFKKARMAWSRAARLGAGSPEMLAGIKDLEEKGY